MTAPVSNSRIVVVDCLRGFALMGLFIVHMVEYYELYWYLPEPGWVHNLVFFLFGGKAYAIFSLLFGLSFFIIMDNQAKKGVDFRARFAWRLALLCMLGYLHGLLYSGDILQVLALSGFLLILIFPLSNRWILILATACLLQLPLVLQFFMHQIGGESTPPLHGSLMGETFSIYAHGGVLDVLQRNLWYGQAGKWLFMLESGRIWTIVGLFLVGFVLGRVRFFENYRQKLQLCFAALAVTLVLLIAGHTAQAVITVPELNEILSLYLNTAFTVCGVLLFLLAYEVRILQKMMKSLAPCGRLSLTIYVGQSLFGVPLFYGFGLGLYQGLGQVSALLLGLFLWSVQMWLAHLWMNRFYYGPLEWLWRSATYLSLDVPWKRDNKTTWP